MITDRLIAYFADPECERCAGDGIIPGRVWPIGGTPRHPAAVMRDPDQICTCVPKITIEARE